MTPEVARQVREREQVIAERAREAATQAMGEGAEGLDAAKLARVARLMGHDASARIVATLKPSEIDRLLVHRGPRGRRGGETRGDAWQGYEALATGRSTST
jgi:hypothetical protein